MTPPEALIETGARHRANLREAQNSQIRALLLVLVSVSVYTSIPLLSGGRLLVPSVATVALGPILLFLAWRAVTTADKVFLAKITFVLLLSMAFSPGYEHLQGKFLGLVQCCMGIGVAVLVVRLMQQTRFQVLERTLLVLWCLILIGCVLEIAGITREASDAFRQRFYAGMFTLIDSDLRDINMVGWPRPKLFSSEPSHVTKFFIASVNSWLLLRVTWRKIAVVAAATLAMVVIMASPMLVVSAVITAAIVLLNPQAQVRTKVAMTFAVLLFGGLFIAYAEISSVSTLANRISDVGQVRSGSVGSEQIRTIYPYVMLTDTWARWPLFGVGISGREVLFESGNYATHLITNAMAEMGIYLGVVGCGLFVYVLLRQAAQMGVGRLVLLSLIVALFSQLMGGFVAFRFWGFVGLLWGALAVADANEKKTVPT